jgi:predicted RecA/RadA family phage recombinase
MKLQTAPGNTIDVTAPYTVASGAGCQVGSMFGVAAYDAASGATVTLSLENMIVTLAKTSAQAWTVGQLLYWDNTNKVVTSAAGTANVKIGFAAAVAANPSSTGSVRLNASF